MQKTVCKLVEAKWVKIQRFWLTLKNGLNNWELSENDIFNVDFFLEFFLYDTRVVFARREPWSFLAQIEVRLFL